MTLSPADATVGTDTHVDQQHKHIVTIPCADIHTHAEATHTHCVLCVTHIDQQHKHYQYHLLKQGNLNKQKTKSKYLANQETNKQQHEAIWQTRSLGALLAVGG